jgi:hypothetical protein
VSITLFAINNMTNLVEKHQQRIKEGGRQLNRIKGGAGK